MCMSSLCRAARCPLSKEFESVLDGSWMEAMRHAHVSAMLPSSITQSFKLWARIAELFGDSDSFKFMQFHPLRQSLLDWLTWKLFLLAYTTYLVSATQTNKKYKYGNIFNNIQLQFDVSVGDISDVGNILFSVLSTRENKQTWFWPAYAHPTKTPKSKRIHQKKTRFN